MKSRITIEIDFQEAKRQAARLETIADKLTNLSRRDFENTLGSLRANWRGDNANKYVNKGSALQSNMTQTASELRKAASTIRQIAQNIYNAEMEALRIAEQRAYGGGGGGFR